MLARASSSRSVTVIGAFGKLLEPLFRGPVSEQRPAGQRPRAGPRWNGAV